MTDRVLAVPKRNGFKAMFKAFLHFLPIFLENVLDGFSKWSVCRNFEKSSNMPKTKNWQQMVKSLLQFDLS